jgi:hypothetical protein
VKILNFLHFTGKKEIKIIKRKRKKKSLPEDITWNIISWLRGLGRFALQVP